jgi:hypothetical protein
VARQVFSRCRAPEMAEHVASVLLQQSEQIASPSPIHASGQRLTAPSPDVANGSVFEGKFLVIPVLVPVED